MLALTENMVLWSFCFFPLQSDISSITCNDTHVFQNVLVEGGLEYIEALLCIFSKISFK